MEQIGRRELLLLMIGIDPEGRTCDGLSGTTRLQKLLFLLEREEKIKATPAGYEFEAYDAGPYSSQVYDDLQVLENLGFISSEVTAESTEEEEAEIDRISFDSLIVDSPPAADSYEERRFYLTPKGKERIESMLSSGDYAPLVDGIRRIKSNYGHFSLRDLLYHVYTTYPDMTTESKIREKVLSRRAN